MSEGTYTIPIPDYEKVHILLDQETLSREPNAAVTELAAISMESGASFDCLIAPPDPGSTPAKFFDIDPETVEWHDKRTNGNYIEYVTFRGSHYQTAAMNFLYWINTMARGRPIVIWTHGTDFDIPILKNLIISSGFEIPFKYNDVMDFRSISKLFPEIKYVKGNHSALDDVMKMHSHFQKILNASPLVASYIWGKD